MEQHDNFNFWAVVTSPSGKYLGLVGEKGAVLNTWKEEGILLMREAYEFVCMNVMQQTPNGPAISREIRALPLGSNRDVFSVHVKPSDIWFLADMKEPDKKTYKDLVEGARAMQRSQRMTDAGLVGARSLNDLPNVPRGFKGG